MRRVAMCAVLALILGGLVGCNMFGGTPTEGCEGCTAMAESGTGWCDGCAKGMVDGNLSFRFASGEWEQGQGEFLVRDFSYRSARAARARLAPLPKPVPAPVIKTVFPILLRLYQKFLSLPHPCMEGFGWQAAAC